MDYEGALLLGLVLPLWLLPILAPELVSRLAWLPIAPSARLTVGADALARLVDHAHQPGPFGRRGWDARKSSMWLAAPGPSRPSPGSP